MTLDYDTKLYSKPESVQENLPLAPSRLGRETGERLEELRLSFVFRE
jgi:hypothetical protein